MRPPIADPNEIRRNRFTGEGTRAFRIRFWPYFVASSVPVVFLIWPILGAILYPTFARQPEDFLPVMAGILALFIATTLVICALFYWFGLLRINGWGIRAFTFWGVPREVSWSQITSVRFKWSLLPYAVTSTTKGQNLWIALFLQDNNSFAHAVAEHSAPDHPLQQFLRQRGWLN